ncbi:MAG: tRNA (adenosine(37)-N6)-threonylcarbamoyltransferase complex transferase subunit TsaD, partial [Ignavibacteriaceae bacterium]|nr:tRNA (adenosine(37)-N6)-threonylcarbamoyltransferase complex transferase subunit TsaD [Ignavibacteriaceae bacterium]
LRDSASSLAEKYKLKLVIPSLEYCGDNAAMIAFRGQSLYEAGIRDTLESKPFPGLIQNHFLEMAK